MPTKRTTEERFWSKVDRNGPIPQNAPHLGPCWIWLASADQRGYGIVVVGGRRIRAHRWAYLQTVGPIGQGLELDHLCRVHGCVRPSHLEAVTHRENVLRGESPSATCAKRVTCPQGHPYGDNNLVKWHAKRGARMCKVCQREHSNTWTRRHRRAD